MVKVIVATSDPAATQRWQGLIQAALPEFQVIGWQLGDPESGAQYAVVWSAPDSFFQTENELKAVFSLGAGVDHLLALPNLPDIPVLRLEDAGMATQMAEYVLHSLASLSRGFDTYEAQQRKSRWNPLAVMRHEDWPVGVMGLGKLGGHVAQAVAGLGYPVAGWARSGRVLDGVEVFHGAAQLQRFLARTRVLVNLLPLTSETVGIINARLLAGLRPNAVVINLARGGHVVDEDLLAALDAGRVQAAVLDVFNEEPLPASHPYWSHPRVRVTPHVAAVTMEAEAAQQISERIRRLEQGLSVSGVVHRDTGY